MDSSRLRTGEMVAGIGGIALFVFLFFDWFSAGIDSFDGGGVSGWDGLGGDVTGFVVAVTSVAGVAVALLAMAGRRVNIPAPRGAVTSLLGTWSVLIILWRIFANPGDLKIGIFLGLAAAVAIAVGALMALREDGFEPLIAVAGGRTRVAADTAPPATPAAPPPTETVKAPAATASRSSAKKSPAGRSSGSKSGSRSRSKSSGSTKAKSTRSGSTRKRSSSTRKRSSGGRK